MSMLGKVAVLAAATLGLPFVTGDMQPGQGERDLMPVSERVQSDFCRLIAEIGPNDVGRCHWATRGAGNPVKR